MEKGLTMIKVAEDLAEKYHAGLTDKYGYVYTDHLSRVADRVDDLSYEIIKKTSHIPCYIAAAWLHDIVEDTKLTLEDLVEVLEVHSDAKIAERITKAVEYLTHDKDGTYADYIETIAKAPGEAGEIARAVKIADLLDHIAGPTECPGGLKKRYEKSLYRLIGVGV